ncbi:lysosomal alpha-glucosidase-like [Clytia hemisphaerica]|uniref:P-type domain-containing protein n=1 Tax=Clytia hemisphaerica TaxID=252671 RepID=A0A7M5WUX5_9CNID
MRLAIIATILAATILVPACIAVPLDTCDVDDVHRFDCFPDEGASESKCQERGCCWVPASQNKDQYGVPLNVPYCFYGRGSFSYNKCGGADTDTGFYVDLCMKGKGSPYGDSIAKIRAEFSMETQTRLRVKIYDPANQRYEVPIPVPKVTTKASSTDYDVTVVESPFGFKVTRKSTGTVIFNTAIPTQGFIFADQYLQIASVLPSSNIYGLGEHVLGLKLNTSWSRLSLFSRDIATPEGGVNLYGVHPFYVGVEKDGNAHGVFFKNSNAMDIILQPTPAITYRTIGGILEFYFLMGPTPDSVIQQYTDVVGKPVMPPYWSLGFHLCRYGYNTMDNLLKVHQRMVDNQIPQDTQWNDIDYMNSHLDFTIDPTNFADLPSFSQKLRSSGMHYILMADPAISSSQSPGSYKPYDDGISMDIFVKDINGKPLQGVVWPGHTVFPDFFNPNASVYWYNQIKNFYDNTIKFDGLWIDMNEPSNFVRGSLDGCPMDNKLETPPFVPGIIGGVLSDKTICMTAKQYTGNHYDVHSLYGHSESIATMDAMKKVLGKRSVVITRSSYPGTGHHAGHWLGDNHSQFEDLYRSISGILNFNMFGVPFVGADICGFLGDTNEELCQRWMQLGAFYPFMRNHNNINQKDQDPGAFGDGLIKTSKAALATRYTLLPYLYTLHFESFMTGSTVARPLFFQFPKDANTYGVDAQFMWGDGLMISPVVSQGAGNVNAYVPAGRWYEYYAGTPVDSKGSSVNLPADWEKINLHLRGGKIIPTQQPALTTTASRKLPFGLIIALDENGAAEGTMYLDDGDQLLDNGVDGTTYMNFQVSGGKFTQKFTRKGYTPDNHTLKDFTVLGVSSKPSTVKINGQQLSSFNYDQSNQVLKFSQEVSIMDENTISWA